KRETLDNVVEKVKNIAKGASLTTGATVDISSYELSYDNMLTNQVLSDAFTKNLKEISPRPVHQAEKATGSADMGNVSQVVPSIYPHNSLNYENLVLHTI